MTVLVFADVHLKVTADGEELRKAFAAFLRDIDPDRVDRIVILGDLFDFWFEYREVIFSGYFEVLRAFAELRDRGIEMHLVCGNHDFWAGRFLEEELGFHIHRAAYHAELDGTRVCFVHGDGANPKDYGYRIYKRIARSKLAIALFRLIHPDWAMAIARGVSHSSRTLLSDDEPGAGDEAGAVREYARGIIERGEADVVVCGHVHHQERVEFDTPVGRGEYINTGDWMLHRNYLLCRDGQFTTHTYEGAFEWEGLSGKRGRQETPTTSAKTGGRV